MMRRKDSNSGMKRKVKKLKRKEETPLKRKQPETAPMAMKRKTKPEELPIKRKQKPASVHPSLGMGGFMPYPPANCPANQVKRKRITYVDCVHCSRCSLANKCERLKEFKQEFQQYYQHLREQRQLKQENGL